MPEQDDLNFSPMLNAAIIERDYDMGFNQTTEPVKETPVAESTPKQPEAKTKLETKTEPSEPIKEPFGDGGGGGSPIEDPPPHKNEPFAEFQPQQEQYGGDSDDIGGGDSGGSGGDNDLDDIGFELTNSSAKEFAEVIVNLYDVYGTEVYYNICRININNIDFHISQGNLRPDFRNVIVAINKNNMEALKLKDREKELLKKAGANWLKQMNASWANSQNGALLTVVAVIARQFFEARRMQKANEQMVADLIRNSGGDYMTIVRPVDVEKPNQQDINEEINRKKEAKTEHL